jgi:chloramphenicol 3-O-phosphotransferase
VRAVAALVVLSGPIGAGKSSVARALAKRLVRARTRAVAIDFDLIVDMVERSETFPGATIAWQSARRASAALADGFFDAGITTVIIEGDFWNPFARGDFEPHLRSSIEPKYVTLTVSYDTARARVLREIAGNPLVRPNSRDPVFHAQVIKAFSKRLLQLQATDLVLDTEDRTVDELAEEIADGLRLLGTP